VKSVAYLSVDEFRTRTVMPAEYVDRLQTIAPGFVASQLESASRLDIDAQLRKRYAAPFDEASAPEAVKTWLARLVTVPCWDRRGVDPGDQGFERALEEAERTRKQIAEAADGDKGLYDLPLRDDSKATGISKGGPLAYSEQSPYVGFDGQARVGRQQDANRGGTTRG
jgi:hypothetical protein